MQKNAQNLAINEQKFQKFHKKWQKPLQNCEKKQKLAQL